LVQFTPYRSRKSVEIEQERSRKVAGTMQTSHNDGLVLKLTLALILFALAIAITELTGRALTGTPDADSTQSTTVSLDT